MSQDSDLLKVLVGYVGWVLPFTSVATVLLEQGSASEKGPIQIPGVPPAGERAEINPQSLVNKYSHFEFSLFEMES